MLTWTVLLCWDDTNFRFHPASRLFHDFLALAAWPPLWELRPDGQSVNINIKYKNILFTICWNVGYAARVAGHIGNRDVTARTKRDYVASRARRRLSDQDLTP